MGVNVEMEVQCLPPQVALDLFQKKVGEITLQSHPNIPELANVVAKKCHGLPLALNVIGEAMACKRTVQEWYVLSSYAAEFSGMEDEILPVLKYSYDNLKSEQVKSCLLYCALFPEDDRISKHVLIDYLICEEIIDESEGMERAVNKGYEIIGSLVRSSLLMEEETHGTYETVGTYQVFLHDVVREMALWIASDFGKRKDIFIVRAGAGLHEIPKVKSWNTVKRMSLMSNNIGSISGSMECLQLTTLFLQKNEKLVNIPGDFFRFMPRLVVLDLSFNRRLSDLPDGISELVSLRYLNLSYTDIQFLPVGIRELKNLIHLDLEDTHRLSSIVGRISALLNLKVLKLLRSNVSYDLDTMEELQVLEHLESLTIGISSDSDFDWFLSSHKLMRVTEALRINDCELESSDISVLASMEKLHELICIRCTYSEIKMDTARRRSAWFLCLSRIHLMYCKGVRELAWLMFAPNLAMVSVEGAKELEDVISKEKAGYVGKEEESEIVLLQKLRTLRLFNLPELKNIYWSPLRFPCLTRIHVLDCPKLRKLPIDSKSGSVGEKGLVIICRKGEWLEEVEWEDEATKARFLSSCIQMEY